MSNDTIKRPVSQPVPPTASCPAKNAAVTEEPGAQTLPTREENGAAEPSGAETSARSAPKDVPPRVLELRLQKIIQYCFASAG